MEIDVLTVVGLICIWYCSEPGPSDAGLLRREREPGAVPDAGAGAEQWRRRQQRQQVDGHRVHVLPHRRLPQRLLLGTLQDLRHLPGHLCARKSHTSTPRFIYIYVHRPANLPIFVCQKEYSIDLPPIYRSACVGKSFHVASDDVRLYIPAVPCFYFCPCLSFCYMIHWFL